MAKKESIKESKVEELRNSIENESEIFYNGFEGVSLDIFSLEKNPQRRVLRGKGIFNDVRNGFTFTQNPPRTNRNKKCGQVSHGIMMERPDGNYVMTIRFNPNEKYLEATLCSEVKNLLKTIKK